MEISSLFTFEFPSILIDLPCLWNTLVFLCLYTRFIWHWKIKLILLYQPSLLLRLVFVHWQHGKPGHRWSCWKFSTVGVPGEPLPFSVGKGVMHVLFLIWVLHHFEFLILILFISTYFGCVFSFLCQSQSTNSFVFKLKAFTTFHFCKNVSQFFLKFARLRIWVTIGLSHLLSVHLSMSFVFGLLFILMELLLFMNLLFLRGLLLLMACLLLMWLLLMSLLLDVWRLLLSFLLNFLFIFRLSFLLARLLNRFSCLCLSLFISFLIVFFSITLIVICFFITFFLLRLLFLLFTLFLTFFILFLMLFFLFFL